MSAPRLVPNSRDILVAAARKWAFGGDPSTRAEREGAHVPTAADLRQWSAIEHACEAKRSRGTAARLFSRRISRLVFVSAFAVVAALGVLRLSRQSAEPLTFSVSSGSMLASVARSIRADSAARNVSFSDGSRMILAAESEGVVVQTTERGAVVRLNEGRARFSVVHRDKTAWTIEAGPFSILVHGTEFDVGWAARDGKFHVDLWTGSVTVLGPLTGNAVTLTPGQRFSMRADGTSYQVGKTPTFSADASAIAPTPAEMPSAETPVSAESPELDTDGEDVSGARPDRTRQRNLGRVSKGSMSVWPRLVAAGDFRTVLAEAEARGLDACVRRASASELSALADAARYGRRTRLARHALLAHRERFPGTGGAHDAAFLLGRLTEDAGHDARGALRWYDQYLSESTLGSYDSEALGRKMMVMARSGDAASAKDTARLYLDRFPNGAYATRARRLRSEN